MIVTAFEYLKQTQRFLREQKQDFENPDDLVSYINRARREVAGRTQCVRRLTPISGQVVDANIIHGGTGYTAPVAVVTPPDFPSGILPNPLGAQATAAALMQRGVLVRPLNGFGAPTKVRITIGSDEDMALAEPILVDVLSR
jgi:hypothetical protein